MRFLNNFEQQAYALFRIVTGFLFLFHGTEKLFNFPIEFQYPMSNLLTAAGVIELVTGVLVMLGFFSRFAAFIASGTMAFAYWMVHGLNNPFPIANGGETATFFCFAFLYIACKGSGIWSINGK